MYSFSIITGNLVQTITPFLKLLNQEIPEDVLKSRLNEMIVQGYVCVGIYSGEKIIGIAGMWIRTNYYAGKHIEPENVILQEEYRSAGIGKALITWIQEYGASNGCLALELNCYLANKRGQKFWLDQGLGIIGLRFQKRF